jgi:hypothetical protein
MEAHEDSLLRPFRVRVTAAADRSNLKSTTILVSEGYCLPRVLQQAFDDGPRPTPLALLAQVLQSHEGRRGHEIPVDNLNLSDPTSETALFYLLTIIHNGAVREESLNHPNSESKLLAHIAPLHRHGAAAQ